MTVPVEVIVTAVAGLVGAYLWGRSAYRSGYWEGARDSKMALDLMVARGELLIGPELEAQMGQATGDFGSIPPQGIRFSNSKK